MSNVHYNQFRNRITAVYDYIKDKDILYLENTSDPWNGQSLTIEGKELVNFGTCGYLGLETDKRLINKAKEYIDISTAQFSTSRTFLVSNLLTRLEAKLSQVFFLNPVLLYSSTTLAHVSVIPAIIGQNDCVIIDKDTHFSIQNATQLLVSKNISIQMIKHNNMEMLENRIKKQKEKYEKIWYCIDGVYSMHGDLAPIDAINSLMDKYEQLHIYIDDAHGVGWSGTNGTGVFFEKIIHKDRMIFTASMAKAFGSSGGIVVLPNKEDYQKVKIFGGPLSYSHPLTPPQIGASMAAAEIFLSDELAGLQEDLATKIAYCNALLETHQIPVLSSPISPIKFVLIGQLEETCAVIQKIHKDGYFANLALFPAVPINKMGVRFMINRHLTIEQIRNFVLALKRHYPNASNGTQQHGQKPPSNESNHDEGGVRQGA